MFRSQPQAFLALPPEAAESEIRNAIEAMLERYGVSATLAPGTAGMPVSGAVQEALRETDFVIADITGADPNVMIEVGIGLGMGKRLLLPSQSRSGDLPVDLAAQQVAHVLLTHRLEHGAQIRSERTGEDPRRHHLGHECRARVAAVAAALESPVPLARGARGALTAPDRRAMEVTLVHKRRGLLRAGALGNHREVAGHDVVRRPGGAPPVYGR